MANLIRRGCVTDANLLYKMYIIHVAIVVSGSYSVARIKSGAAAAAPVVQQDKPSKHVCYSAPSREKDSVERKV